jgi:hypothetical protein
MNISHCEERSNCTNKIQVEQLNAMAPVPQNDITKQKKCSIFLKTKK